MTKTLLEMSELRTVPCNDVIELAPMLEEIFTDLTPLAEKRGITLEYDGNGTMVGSDTLIYRMLFNLTENAIRYNRQNECVRASVSEQDGQIFVRVRDNGSGIPEQYKESIFQRSFVSINHEVGNMAVSDLVYRLFGKLLRFTVAESLPRKARKTERLCLSPCLKAK